MKLESREDRPSTGNAGGRPSRILISDDDAGIRQSLSSLLRSEGYEPIEAEDGQSALRIIRDCVPDLMLLDVMMPGLSGFDVLASLRKLQIKLPVIMLTGYGTPDVAVEAGSLGVNGILAKPFKNADVALGVRAALAGRNGSPAVREFDSSDDLKMRIGQGKSLGDLMGPSTLIQEVVNRVELVANSDFTVVITGETGVGKEVVTRALHSLSRRADGPFITVDCGAIPESLIESELFGHEKGAFTGADRLHIGCFEAAMGGTLFLDEISNLPWNMQATLLRVLQERQIRRVGGTAAIQVDVRVVAATNQDLRDLVRTEKFRSDLYFRLNEFHLQVPPLRLRPDDVRFFAQQFVEQAAQELGKPSCTLSREGEQALLEHPWPGNVRELRNAVRQAVLLAHDTIEAKDLCLVGGDDLTYEECSGERLELAEPDPDDSFKEIVQQNTVQIEKAILLRTLRQTGGNLKEAARLLKMDYKTMRTKAKRYNLLAQL